MGTAESICSKQVIRNMETFLYARQKFWRYIPVTDPGQQPGGGIQPRQHTIQGLRQALS